MPTIIDSFIVQLGLDPTKFTTGQKQAVATLQNMQRQTTNLQRSVQQTMQNLQSSQQNIGNQLNRGPGNAYNRFFNNIVSQSRRSGAAVAAGAKQGQHSLLAMAAAGTAAFTAISAVQRVAQTFTSTIAQTAATGRIAAASGVPGPWLSRLQNASYRRTAADQGQTAESVFGLRQQIERLQAFGEWSDQLKKLSILGIDFTSGDPNDIVQRIFTTELPKYLKSLSLPRATAFGTDIGLSRELTQFYHQYNPTAEMGGRAGNVSATQQDIDRAAALAAAIRNIETAWTGLIRRVQTANPMWTEWADQFSKWLEDVQQSPQAMERMGQVATAVIGVTMVAAVGTFLKAVMAANARIIASPVGVLILAAMGAKALVSPNAPSQEAHDFASNSWSRWLDPNYYLGRGVYGKPHGPAASDDRNWWERNAPGFLGGREKGAGGSGGGAGTTAPGAGAGGTDASPSGAGGTATAANLSGGNRSQQAMAYFMSRGWTKEQAAGIVSNLIRESNLREGVPGDGGLAYGIGQWHPDRQANFRRAMGKDIRGSSYAEQLAFVDWELNNTEKAAGDRLRASRTARDSGGIVSRYYERPKDVYGNMADRAALAEKIAMETANRPAVTSAAATGVRGQGATQQSIDAARAARGERTIHPPGTQFNKYGEAVSSTLGTMTAQEKANVEQSMAAIKAAQVSGKGGWGTPAGGGTSTTNHGNVQIDKIEVTTQATNPYAIGGGIAGALKSNLIASQANTGLE